MRPLSEEELKLFLEKLSRYIGTGVKQLVERSDEPHVFRLHNQRVYYVGENLLKKGTRFFFSFTHSYIWYHINIVVLFLFLSIIGISIFFLAQSF